MTAPVELVRELLHYRDMRFGNYRDWGMVTAFVAGSSLALPILAPIALGGIVAYGIYAARQHFRRRQAIVGVELVPPSIPHGATVAFGIPRKFRATMASLFDDAPVLVEHAVIKNASGAVLVRRSDATPFLLEEAGGPPTLVAGVMRILPANMLVRRMRIERGDPRLARMGIPADLAIAGELEVASVVADGARLAVRGRREEEAIPELAFHRDGGRIAVMRGTIGAPVTVEDPRMVAVMLDAPRV